MSERGGWRRRRCRRVGSLRRRQEVGSGALICAVQSWQGGRVRMRPSTGGEERTYRNERGLVGVLRSNIQTCEGSAINTTTWGLLGMTHHQRLDVLFLLHQVPCS